MFFSAGTSGVVHATIVAASLFSLPAIELAFGDVFGRGQARDVLTYGEAGDFQSKFSSGALTADKGEENSDETSSGIDPDDSADTDSSGEFGFDEAGDADSTDSRFGSPDEVPVAEAPAGGEGAGDDQAVDASADGSREDEGDTGEDEETGEPATREIIVFVNLAPDPDREPVDTEPARREGPTDIPSQFASLTDGEAPPEIAALESDEVTTGEPASGDPEGLEDGETDAGRKSEDEATAAAAPNEGEISPPDSAAGFQTEQEGGAPEDIPVADTASLAPVETTTARIPDETPSGTESPTEATTVVEQATGTPGLPDQNNDLESPDTPLPADAEAQPELAETVPAKTIEGFDTPGQAKLDHEQLVDPEEPGKSLANIGTQASGIDEEIEGERGPINDTNQWAVDIADGNLDAQRAASEAEESRDGVLENGVDEAEITDDTNLPNKQIASLDSGEEFRAPDAGERDRVALIRGPDDPLAAVIAAIAGEDEELARAITEGPPTETLGGNPDPGALRTNQALEKAADAGLAQAQTQLAKRYLLGLVDGSNPDELVELLRNAAERGDEDAQLLLGALFADGRIVPKDNIQSHVFFELAAAQGNEEANNMLPILERQMEPREVVDSRRLAREYKLFMDATADPRLRGSSGNGLRDQLLNAAAAGNTAQIAELLSRGADLEGEDTAGRTAVINAAWRGEQEVVDLLVELDADLNVADYDGRTAVSWAASNGHVDIVRKLLENGAAPDVVDKESLTPLMRAAWNGHDEVVRLLIDAGAPIALRDENGNSALDYAVQGGHREIARVLRAFGA